MRSWRQPGFPGLELSCYLKWMWDGESSDAPVLGLTEGKEAPGKGQSTQTDQNRCFFYLL